MQNGGYAVYLYKGQITVKKGVLRNKSCAFDCQSWLELFRNGC